jgi:hypothetical protein
VQLGEPDRDRKRRLDQEAVRLGEQAGEDHVQHADVRAARWRVVYQAGGPTAALAGPARSPRDPSAPRVALTMIGRDR